MDNKSSVRDVEGGRWFSPGISFVIVYLPTAIIKRRNKTTRLSSKHLFYGGFGEIVLSSGFNVYEGHRILFIDLKIW